jgi:hypothetical protein
MKTINSVAHTPGPWTYGKHQREIYSKEEGISIVRLPAWGLNTPEYEETDDANARLITAAPDLLSAAKHMADLVGRLQDPRLIEAYKQLCSAIAKAE